jgi:hypothetical protein
MPSRTSALLLLALAACGKSTPLTTGNNVACDPLAARPITLGTVVGVGQDASGTLYVDAANGVFVSQSGQLIRQHVTGSGQSGSDQFIFTIQPPTPDAGASAVNLLVQTDGTTAVAMGLGPTGSKAFLGQASGVTLLTIAPASTVSGMPLVNTPDVISYVADIQNGDVLMTTVPMNDDPAAPNGGLSLFYGPPGAVAQRPITSFQQSLSGNGTLTFQVGGVPTTLAFGNVPAPDAGPFGVFALQSLTPQGGAPMSATLRSPTPTSTPPELSFTCSP